MSSSRLLKPADLSRRDRGERFLVHLCDCGLFKEEWRRAELTSIYDNFCGHGRSAFGGVLYQMSRSAPKLLHVHRGTTVIFKRSESSDHYWNELISREDKLEISVKCHIDESSVKQFSKNHFVCDISVCDTLDITLEAQFTNNSGSPAWLKSWRVLDHADVLDFSAEVSQENLFIDRGKHHSLHIPCPKLQKMKILFNFNETAVGQSFSSAIVVDFNVAEMVAPAEQVMIDRISQQQQGATKVLFGVKYKFSDDGMKDVLKKSAPLPPSLVPKPLAQMIHINGYKRQTMACITDRSIAELLRAEISLRNYSKKFHYLLYLEELQYVEDVKSYNDYFAIVRRGQNLYMEVPGLAEKRPSILRGDRLFARKVRNGIKYGDRYEGFVHFVKQTEIQLKFHNKLHVDFQHISEMKFSIEFFLKRFPLKLMHRTLDSVTKYSMLLFPSAPRCSSEATPALRIKNTYIEKNELQHSAVKAILRDDAAPVYVIYGPPGTGKTVTMVEAIHQTFEIHPHFHILVCAPSNSACDLLTTRLLKHFDKSWVCRMHAASRQPDAIPQVIRDVSNVNMNGLVYFDSKENMMKFKVIVCTLITAGRISSAEFPDGHFNRIFIDESGQSTEPELLVAVAGILSKDGKLVLAGDPKQLGPIVRSPIAKSHGLQLSFLERLMGTQPYQKQDDGKYNRLCVTKLTKNYRSHEAIIKISNEEFYEKELEVCADKFMRNSLCQWNELPRKGFPLIFKHVEGKDEQEQNSPSFFNSAEIKEVKRLVEVLLSERRCKVKPAEIGIITPYRKQVQKIRRELQNDEIKVGSVEEFQGQERRVIIISTVRSKTVNLNHDAKFHLGFVADPKRFNVAVTRAKSLLIIVGNARILCMDPYWRKLHQHCLDNGAYVGPRFDTFGLPDLRKFHAVIDEQDGENAEEDLNAPEWRLDP